MRGPLVWEEGVYVQVGHVFLFLSRLVFPPFSFRGCGGMGGNFQRVLWMSREFGLMNMVYVPTVPSAGIGDSIFFSGEVAATSRRANKVVSYSGEKSFLCFFSTKI